MAFTQIPVDSIPPLVDSLIQVSRAHTGETEFDEAFAASELAGEAAQDCCGENSAAYAAYCFNEGRIRYFMGRNNEALPWYIQARTLRGQVLGTDHIEYGKSCNNLAIAYDVLGRYEEAEPLYHEALAIREKKLGRASTACAKVLANLGGMYSEMGDFELAEQLILETLAIRKQILGDQDPEYADGLLLLANHYYDIFNYENLEALLLEAKHIYEAQEYLDFYNYVNVLQMLGAYYQVTSNLIQAQQYYAEAGSLIEEVLGKNTLDYSGSLSQLARTAYKLQDFDLSESYIEQQLKILEELEFQQDPLYGFALQDLSSIKHLGGDASNALSLIEKAISIFEKTYSPNHSWNRSALKDKVSICQTLGDYETASETLQRVFILEEKPLASAVRHLSNQELQNYIDYYRDLLFLALQVAENHPDLTSLCYNKVLFYKGFLLNNALSLRQKAMENEDSKPLYRELRGYHRRLAQLYSSHGAESEEILALEQRAELVEKELTRTLADDNLLTFEMRWQDVQAMLSPSEASIEIIAYNTFNYAGEAIATHHTALIVLPGSQPPIYLKLASQSDLEQLLTNDNSNADLINQLYSWEGKGEQLYRMSWQPIEGIIQANPEIETIYYANDGLFHRLNLGAIPTPKGRVLAQEYKLVAITSTRSLLFEPTPPDTTNRKALLYGGIDYGTSEPSNAPDGNSTSKNTETRGDYNSSMRGYNPQNGYWQSLPWTEIEVSYADEVLTDVGYQTILRAAKQASETHLKEITAVRPSPRIIHLATHGYFFGPVDHSSSKNSLPFEQAKQSMIRSGLILADGNFAWVNGRTRDEAQDDGVLTALEVSQLELQDTEIVILSACETGLGDIQKTEGVFGLQRALKLAGVRYIIISLWQVPDYQAQALMSSFYLAWLEEGNSVPNAFRSAQAYMRARYKNAFDWAGFVLLQ